MTAIPASASPTPSRAAVLVRTQAVSEKLLHLVAELRRGLGYDVFVCADETAGPLDLGGRLADGAGVLRHSEADAAALGLVAASDKRLPPDAKLLWFFGDAAFYASFAAIPDYDHYVLLDDKLAFVRGNPLFPEGLVRRLQTDGEAPYDLVSTWLGERPPEWIWHATAAASFANVHGMFSPLAVLSRRALCYLHRWRQREAASSGPCVFWEALLPSALIAAGDFRCADVNTLIPGAWDPGSFPASAPMLLGCLPPLLPAVELAFPVASEREYLAWLLGQARARGTVPDLVGRLAPGGDLNVSPPVRAWFLREALRTLGSDTG